MKGDLTNWKVCWIKKFLELIFMVRPSLQHLKIQVIIQMKIWGKLRNWCRYWKTFYMEYCHRLLLWFRMTFLKTFSWTIYINNKGWHSGKCLGLKFYLSHEGGQRQVWQMSHFFSKASLILSIQMPLLGAWQFKRIPIWHIFVSLFVYSIQF